MKDKAKEKMRYQEPAMELVTAWGADVITASGLVDTTGGSGSGDDEEKWGNFF